jgi:hypothetical protein
METSDLDLAALKSGEGVAAPLTAAEVNQPERLSEMIPPAASTKPVEILYLDPTTLTDHPEATHIPRTNPETMAKVVQDMAAVGFRHEFPIRVLPDRKTVVDGRIRRDSAIQNKLALVPCVIDTSDDPVDSMYVAALLRGRLTDDQYAYVQFCRQKHLSTVYKAARGQKATMARYECLLVENANKHTDTGKRNARKETAQAAGVTEYRLRQLGEIEAKEKSVEVPPDHSVMPKIRDGVKRIKAAHKEVVGVQEDADFNRRLEDAAKLPAIANWHNGDETPVVFGLEPQTIALLILDSTHMANPETALESTSRFMRKDCGVILITDFHHERTGIQALLGANYEVIDRVIWYTHLPKSMVGKGPSGRHHSVILARRGDFEFVGPNEVRLADPLIVPRDKGYAEALPQALLKAMIDVATVAGELVAIPFDRLASGYVAARQLRRNVVAAEYGEGYLLGRKRLDEVFDEPARVDQEIEAEIAVAGFNPAAELTTPEDGATAAGIPSDLIANNNPGQIEVRP